MRNFHFVRQIVNTQIKKCSMIAVVLFILISNVAPQMSDAFQRKSRISPDEKRHPNVRNAFKSIASKATEATVRVLADDKQIALGTIVDQSGLIVTKASLLKGKLSCRTSDGKTHDAKLIETDQGFDLAILQVVGEGFQTVSFSDAAVPRSASWVVSVGAEEPVLSVGVTSSEPRKFNLRENRNTSDRGFLGVMVQPDADGGVEIIQIVKKSSAEAAGLKVGDVIMRADAKKLAKPEDLIQLLSAKKPGNEVNFQISRDDEPEERAIKLGKFPQQTSASPYDRWGGGPFSARRFSFPKVLPHDSLLKPDQCGGPVLDSDGRFVGINISRALRISSYTILAADIKRIVDTAKAKRTATSQSSIHLPTQSSSIQIACAKPFAQATATEVEPVLTVADLTNEFPNCYRDIDPTGIIGRLILSGDGFCDHAFESFLDQPAINGDAPTMTLLYFAGADEKKKLGAISV